MPPAIALGGSDARGALVRSFTEATEGVADDLLDSPRGLRLVVEGFLERQPARGDALAKARLRGLLAQREILEIDGGALATADVAQLLGMSTQAVNKRRIAHKLLALSVPKRGFLYPAWQFSDEGTLRGFESILAVLKESDAWAITRFFLYENDRLERRRPIDVLRAGDVNAVKRAAESFGVHGAA